MVDRSGEVQVSMNVFSHNMQQFSLVTVTVIAGTNTDTFVLSPSLSRARAPSLRALR